MTLQYSQCLCRPWTSWLTHFTWIKAWTPAVSSVCSGPRPSVLCSEMTWCLLTGDNKTQTHNCFFFIDRVSTPASAQYLSNYKKNMWCMGFSWTSSTLQPRDRCDDTAGQLDWQVLPGCWRLCAGSKLRVHPHEHGKITGSSCLANGPVWLVWTLSGPFC